MNPVTLFLALTPIVVPFATVRADVFLDLTSVTPGSSGVGAFSGTLGGISVTGSISGAAVLSFNAIGSGLGDSTIDGSSPSSVIQASSAPRPRPRIGSVSPIWRSQATW